jgi:hypothetical protein
MKNFQNKSPNLLCQTAQISEAYGRQASLEIEQFRGFEKLQG